MTEMRKFYAEVQLDPSLGERQIRVIANSGKSDRAKDVLIAKGCKLDNYLNNNIVLADHDRKEPIGNFAPEIVGESVAGVMTFAPKGISAKADQYCGLYKAGVMKSVSVGFAPIEYDVNKDGGCDFKQWELLELSCVAVPCDPAAVVTARSLTIDPDRQSGKLAEAFGVGDGRADAAKAAELVNDFLRKDSWKCGASLSLPIINDDDWDSEEAAKSIFEHCGFDRDKPDVVLARKGFLAYDAANPTHRSSYLAPFARVIDGRLRASATAIRTAVSDGLKCHEKSKAVLDHYEAKMEPIVEENDEKALSMAEMEHVKGMKKCMAAMGDCLTKALDSHGETHDQLTQFAQHHAMAGEHIKALAKSGRKKPKPDDGEGSEDPESDPGDDPDDNIELAVETERRKRMIEIARRAA